jgi:uncharacterized protein YggE
MEKRKTMTRKPSIAFAVAVVALAAVVVAYLAVLPGLAAKPALAETNLPQTAVTPAAPSGIQVTGTGDVHVTPDLAVTNIGIEVTSATLSEATDEANTKMAAVIDKIKGLGVADKDIQTTSYNVNPLTDQSGSNNSTPKITGYRVSNQVSVTVRKIGDLGKILDAATSAGANNIYGVNFGVADPTSFQQQARAAAVKDAQDKANQLAQAGGLTLGKIVSIDETQESQPIPRSAAPLAFSAAGSVPIQTGELEISVSVNVRFALQ